MSQFDVPKMLEQLKRVYVERVVRNGFEDKSLYNDELMKLNDLELQEFDDLKKIIGQTKAMPKTNQVDINNQGLTDEQYEELEDLEKKSKKRGKDKQPLTEEEKKRLEELKKKKNNREAAISILRGISIRMPLLIYGAELSDESKDITIDNFASLIDPQSWEEFMPKGVTKQKFNSIKKYYDPEIFCAAGKRIRAMARAADKLSVEERIERITDIFSTFRNPDKETVLTPWRVVNMHLGDCLGGYNFLSEDRQDTTYKPVFIDNGEVTQDTLANDKAKILEINSKTGLYPLYVAYSIFKTKCEKYNENDLTEELQERLWQETVENNIFVICKTPMAKQITKRTLVGYKNIKVNAHYFEDLINQMQNKPKQFKDRILKPSYWNIKGDSEMEFDAIVGNPPYQENISDDTNNSSLSKQLFPAFIKNTIELKPKYNSLITPSRWFTGDAQDKSFIKLREFVKSNNHFYKIFNYPNNKDLFKGVEIAGGINYYLYDSIYEGDVEFIERSSLDKTSTTRPLFEEGMDIILSMNSMVTIINKVKNSNDFISMTTITKGRNAFGIVGKKSELDKISKEKYFDEAVKIQCAYEEFRYIEKNKIIKNIELIDNWKIFTSKGNGGAGILADGKPVAIIGKAYIGEPNSICTDSLIPIGDFKTKDEAVNLQKYMASKFLRFMVGALKVSQNIYQNVYQFVPIQDFTNKSDINWNDTIENIDKQLCAKYNLDENEISFIESMIKPME